MNKRVVAAVYLVGSLLIITYGSPWTSTFRSGGDLISMHYEFGAFWSPPDDYHYVRHLVVPALLAEFAILASISLTLGWLLVGWPHPGSIAGPGQHTQAKRGRTFLTRDLSTAALGLLALVFMALWIISALWQAWHQPPITINPP